MGSTLALSCCAQVQIDTETFNEDLVNSYRGHAEAQAKLLAVWDQVCPQTPEALRAAASKLRAGCYSARCCPVIGPTPCLYSVDPSLNSEADWCSPGSATSSTSPAEAVCCLVRAEWFENRYSGLFRKADFGLARLSLMQPPEHDGPSAWRQFTSLFSSEHCVPGGSLAPALALKFFRGGEAPSGNLLFVGQAPVASKAQGLLGQCLCSQSAQVGSSGIGSGSPQASSLSRHSAWPNAMGLSGFASLGQDGREARGSVDGDVVESPWALVLRPLPGSLPPADPGSKELSRLMKIPPGTALYEVFACPSPGAAFEAGWIQPLGRIVTASKFTPEPFDRSLPKLRFRHQRKEEDYMMRPEWLQELSAAHGACGSEHFERLLERRQRSMAAQGGSWTPDVLPCTRWVWTNSLQAAWRERGFPRCSSEPASPTSARTGKRDNTLAASLRQRGGRCAPEKPQTAQEEHTSEKCEQEADAGGSYTNFSLTWLLSFLGLLVLVAGPMALPARPGEAQESPPAISAQFFFCIAVVLLLVTYRMCFQGVGDEAEEEFEECVQEDSALPRNWSSDLWREESTMTRERTLVRGVSAHELLLQ